MDKEQSSIFESLLFDLLHDDAAYLLRARGSILLINLVL
jgi:hypothetical protein